MKRKTARERAARAYMPIMLIAKEAVITVVEVEIKSAISDALEEAATIADEYANERYSGEQGRDIADKIRALKEKE